MGEAADRNAVGAGVGEVAECKWVGVSIRLHLVRCNVGIGGVLEAGVAKLAAAACSCAVVFDAAGLKKSRMSAPFSWGSGAFRLDMLTVTGPWPSVDFVDTGKNFVAVKALCDFHGGARASSRLSESDPDFDREMLLSGKIGGGGSTKHASRPFVVVACGCVNPKTQTQPPK